MFSGDSKTVFAAKGSRNILNSAYLFKGTVKTFPVSLSPWLKCPPTIYTSCKDIWLHQLKLPIPSNISLIFSSDGLLPELERQHFSLTIKF